MKVYSLLSGDVCNETRFVNEVNNLISDGWECLGGVVYVARSQFVPPKFYQTMVRDRPSGTRQEFVEELQEK